MKKSYSAIWLPTSGVAFQAFHHPFKKIYRYFKIGGTMSSQNINRSSFSFAGQWNYVILRLIFDANCWPRDECLHLSPAAIRIPAVASPTACLYTYYCALSIMLSRVFWDICKKIFLNIDNILLIVSFR